MEAFGRGMSTLIDSAYDVLLNLAIHPLALEIDADGARILAVMRENALLTRSRGPYSEENLPPEALAMAEWVALRWSVKPERPDFTIEGGGPWPGLVVSLPVSRVRVHYVVPEGAPPVYQPDPNNVTLTSDIKLALRFLADSLREAAKTLGEEPPVTLSLSYLDDPDHERQIAALPQEHRHLVPPVIPTLDVGRSRCSKRQRAAHDEAVRSVAYSDQPVEALGRTGFTTRIGFARLRDSGS